MKHFSLIAMLLMSLSLMAEDVTISGRVVDGVNAEGLPGVSVVCLKVNQGTITDLDGQFSLTVPAGSAIQFSYLGYATEHLTAKQSKVVTISLYEESKAIDEIIVVGAKMKKSDLTGAVAKVEERDVVNVPTGNLNQALQGKAAGVFVEANPQPGANANIKIRGNNSISYGTNPLYVVDNIMVDGTDISSINPDDVASIDILKDASATAIYGARAANGVIVITTKHGQEGRMKVTYDGWVGGQEFTRLMPLLDGNQTFDLRVDAYANEYMDANPTKDRQKYIDSYLTIDGKRVSRNVAFLPEELEAHNQGLTYNWLNEVTRPGLQHNHAVSVSGGSKQGNYFASFGYNDQKGQLVGSDYKRYSGKFNGEFVVKKWLRFGTNNSLAFSREHPVGNGNMFMTAYTADPLLPITKDYWYMQQGKLESQSQSNPLRDLDITTQCDKWRVLSSNYVNINPIEGLDIRSTFSIDFLNQENDTYYPTTSTQSYSSSADGKATQYRNRNMNWQWDNTVAYNTTIKNKHRVGVIAGFNMSYYSNNYNQMDALGFGNDLFGYKNIGAATKKEDFGLSSGYTSYSLMSAYVRANYVYDSRYYITFTGRGDGSSKFGPKHKWGFFPSVSASWNITGEEFMQQQHAVDNLRIRAGYGLVGNQNIPLYGYNTLYYTSAHLDGFILENGGTYGNPDLKWETQKQVNVGIDFATWQNRFNFAIDYFYTRNDDLLMRRSMAPSFGYSYRLDNIGNLENQGIEFNFNLQPVKTKNVEWNIAFNIAANKNKIISLYDNAKEIYNIGGWSNNEIQREGNLFVGQSINNIYVYEFDKIAQEEDMAYVSTLDMGGHIVRPGDLLPKDRNGDKIIDDRDRYVVGNTDPKFYGGLSTNVSFYGFNIEIVSHYSYGARRASSLYESLISSCGMTAGHTDLANRWTPTNTNTNIPRAYHGGGRYGVSEMDWGIQDASYFKVSAMSLSYSFPKKWMDAIYFQDLRLTFTVNNPFCATKYKGFDPEGGDWYPTSRMYVGRISLTF